MSTTAEATLPVARRNPSQLVLKQLYSLVVYSLRESLHRWTFLAFLFAVTFLLLLMATAISLDVVEGTLASARLFGQELQLDEFGIRITDVVQTFQWVIIVLLYTFGVGLALFITSNMIPRLCVEGWVDLLLAQPISRSTLIVGRALGAITVVSFNIAYLIIGSWMLLRWKTGFGNAGFLLAGAVIIFAFAVCYSAMVLVGVMTRSSPVSSIAGLFVWVSGHILYFFHTYPAWRTTLRAGWPRNTGTVVTESLYWTLPKSQDLGRMAVDAARGEAIGIVPILYSIPFAIGCMVLACWWFGRRDY